MSQSTLEKSAGKLYTLVPATNVSVLVVRVKGHSCDTCSISLMLELTASLDKACKLRTLPKPSPVVSSSVSFILLSSWFIRVTYVVDIKSIPLSKVKGASFPAPLV